MIRCAGWSNSPEHTSLPSSGASSSIDRHVVSPSLLKSIDSEIQRPCRPEFLLGLGEPFEPNPWDLDCPEDDDAMLQASQVAEEQLSKQCASTLDSQ